MTLEDKKLLQSMGLSVIYKSDWQHKDYIDMEKKPEVWLNENVSKNINFNDVIFMIGTDEHELGHRKDNILVSSFKNPNDKTILTAEEKALAKIFSYTSDSRFGTINPETPSYNLRGSELVRKEIGAYMRVQLSKKLNSK